MDLCPYFGLCGGCASQDIDYNQQLLNKREQIISFWTANNLIVPVDLQIVSGEPWYYRNRMDFVVCRDGIGLRKRKKFAHLVPIRQCLISNKKINQLMQEVWTWYEKNQPNIDNFLLRKNVGTMRYTVMRAPEFTPDASVSFVVNSESPRLSEQIDLIQEFVQSTSASNVLLVKTPAQRDSSIGLDYTVLKGQAVLSEKLLNTEIVYHTQGFAQNNSRMIEKILEYCRQLFMKYDTKDAVLVDLYGGAGTFGLTLRDMFKKVIILDNEGVNIECAKQNVQTHGYKNVEVICGDAAQISELNFTEKLFMIVDPPRPGIHPDTLPKLLKLNAESIIYVSCNPQQQAKELGLFTGYDYSALRIFDLFPQTPHLETVVELVKKSGK